MEGAAAPLTLAEALSRIRAELGLDSAKKPKQVIAAACDQLQLGFEEGKTLKQQVQAICEFIDVATHWDAAPPASASAAQPRAAAADGASRGSGAEEGVPPQHAQRALERELEQAPEPEPEPELEPEPEPRLAAVGGEERASRGEERASRGEVVSQGAMDRIDMFLSKLDEQAEAVEPYRCRVSEGTTVQAARAMQSAHTLYKVEILHGPEGGPHQLITVRKRFREFVALDKALRPLLGKQTIPKLPKKTLIGNKNGAAVVEHRMVSLKAYLDAVTRHVASHAYLEGAQQAKVKLDEFLGATPLDVGDLTPPTTEPMPPK